MFIKVSKAGSYSALCISILLLLDLLFIGSIDLRACLVIFIFLIMISFGDISGWATIASRMLKFIFWSHVAAVVVEASIFLYDADLHLTYINLLFEQQPLYRRGLPRLRGLFESAQFSGYFSVLVGLLYLNRPFTALLLVLSTLSLQAVMIFGVTAFFVKGNINRLFWIGSILVFVAGVVLQRHHRLDLENSMLNVFLNLPTLLRPDQLECLIFGCGTDVSFSNQFFATPLDFGLTGLIYRIGIFGFFIFILFLKAEYRKYFVPSAVTLIHYPVFFSLSGAVVIFLLRLSQRQTDLNQQTSILIEKKR